MKGFCAKKPKSTLAKINYGKQMIKLVFFKLGLPENQNYIFKPSSTNNIFVVSVVLAGIETDVSPFVQRTLIFVVLLNFSTPHTADFSIKTIR